MKQLVSIVKGSRGSIHNRDRRPCRHLRETSPPKPNAFGPSLCARAVSLLVFLLTISISVTGQSQSAKEQHSAATADKASTRFGVFFWHDSLNDAEAFKGVKAALTEVGHRASFIVGRADEDRKAAKQILSDFAAQGVDLVFAMGTEAALLAAEQIKDIPIVFTAVTNPVESGVTPSWQGSKRNLAGNSNWIPPATILHVFRLTVPGLSRLGVIRSRDGVVSAAEIGSLRHYLAAAKVPSLEILDEVVDHQKDIVRAVDRLVARGAEAIWIPIDRLVYTNTREVWKAACVHGIPLVSSSLRGIRTGAIAGVVVDYVMLGKRAAAIALAILVQGKDPGSTAIGTMHGYRVVINLEAARQCDYEVPLSLLVLAGVLLETIESEDQTHDRDK